MEFPWQQKDWDLINSFDYDDLDTFYQEAEQNIKDMKADGAQFIVANMHWGLEYHLTESDDQREIAQKLCDLGVDALIGGHPHCLQPIDVFENDSGRTSDVLHFLRGQCTEQSENVSDDE